MAEDLYASWLDLPAGDRPPDYYALLNVDRFCTDLPAIDQAAHRQLEKLDKYRIHPEADRRTACTKLMNEVAQARVVLTSLNLRKAYDKKLARQLGVPVPKPPAVGPEKNLVPLLQQLQSGPRQAEYELRPDEEPPVNNRLPRSRIKPATRAQVPAGKMPVIEYFKRIPLLIVFGLMLTGLIYIGSWYYEGWKIQASIAEVISKARQAHDKKECANARALLEKALEAVPDRRDRDKLAAPLNTELMALNAKLNELENERPGTPEPLTPVQTPPAQPLARSDPGDLFPASPAKSVAPNNSPPGFTPLAMLQPTPELPSRSLASSAPPSEPPTPGPFWGPKNPALITPLPSDSPQPSLSSTPRISNEPPPAPASTPPPAPTAPEPIPAFILSPTPAQPAPALTTKPAETILKKQLTLDCGKGVKMDLVLIPAGTFAMGSPANEKDRCENEGPQHQVTMGQPYYMGKCEVTQAQWQAVMSKNPSHFSSFSNLPVDSISWEDGQEFCKKLSVKTGQTVRLPTEAEWEYACRAGTTTAYSFGHDPAPLEQYAWFGVNGGKKTHLVGIKKPNAWGLYDMLGNVWERCQDVYHPSFAGAPTDGRAWETPVGPDHVLRGGSWYLSLSKFPHSASRDRDASGSRIGNVGMRVVVDPLGTPAQEAAQPVQPLALDCGNAVKMDLVPIPAGTFTMGSPKTEKDRRDDEGPTHQVTIAQPFYMGKYEVTQGQWQAVMGNRPSRYGGYFNNYRGDPNLPVSNASWEDCQEFCKQLSAQTGQTVRLPSEAEWEYACRAGTMTAYIFGDSSAQLEQYAWFADNSGRQMHPVGSKQPNAWGLYDMHGNVREWCQDFWDNSRYPDAPTGGRAGNGSGGIERVWRGGSYNDDSSRLRSAARDGAFPRNLMTGQGFRVVVDFPGTP